MTTAWIILISLTLLLELPLSLSSVLIDSGNAFMALLLLDASRRLAHTFRIEVELSSSEGRVRNLKMSP